MTHQAEQGSAKNAGPSPAAPARNLSGMSIEEMSHRFAIDDLLTRYAIAVDDDDIDMLDTVFAPDAVLDYTSAGGPRAPYPEVKEWLRGGLGRSHPARLHMIANKRVVIAGDTAKVRAYFFCPKTVTDAAGNLTYSLGGGYYNHLLRLRPEGWRSVELYEIRIWREGFEPQVHPEALRSTVEWDFGMAPRPRSITQAPI